MPQVLCGLSCFDSPSLSTAGATAAAFLAALDPALESRAVEVYRLEPLPLDAPLGADDIVACCLPDWRFDCAALEDLHRQVEELRAHNDALQLQYTRTQEALISLSSSLHASEPSLCQAFEVADALAGMAGTTSAGVGVGGGGSAGARREADGAQGCLQAQLRQQLCETRQQLTEKDKTQQETKAAVIALRSEFMQLVHMMQFSGYQSPGTEMPNVMQELDPNVKTAWTPEAAWSPQNYGCYDVDKMGDCAALRHASQQPPATTIVGGVWRPGGSPRAAMRTSPNSTERDTHRTCHRGAAPGPSCASMSKAQRHRGPPQRGNAHSACASARRAQTAT